MLEGLPPLDHFDRGEIGPDGKPRIEAFDGFNTSRASSEDLFRHFLNMGGARAALATTLDPQGNGAAVRWDNADSGHKGSFAPVGDAYLVKDEICRSFVASLTVAEPERWLQGSACRQSPTEWTIRETKPWKRPG